MRTRVLVVGVPALVGAIGCLFPALVWAATAFQESSGQVVMEAEHYDNKIARNGQDWMPETSKSAYSGSGYLTALPNIGTTQNTGYVTASPELVYNVQFTKTGTYYLWLRASANTGADDSAHAGIDGTGPSSADRISTTYGSSWYWKRDTMDSAPATVVVSTPGLHTIHLWMREDGFQIDKILLRTSSSSTAPSGTGPAESPRVTIDTTPPAISAVTATSVTSTTATIIWTTDEPATTQVEYGLSISYGQTTALNATLVTNHSASLSGLTENTLYHYRVRSKDAVGNEGIGADATFTTAPPPDTTPPLMSGIAASSGQPYQLGTLAMGELVFIDRTYTFTAIPSVYLGAEFIRTANADKTLTNANALTFTLTADAIIYVAYDTRATTLPAWLDDQTWTMTADLIGTNDVSRQLYKKVFPAGQVVLGGNAMSPMAGAGSNYNVIAIPTAPPAGDTTPPLMSGIAASSVTASSATITWTTNEPASSQVEYGTTTSYGSATALDATPVTSHSVAISTLTAGTLYHCRVRSKDAAGNEAVSPDATFTTASPADTTPPAVSLSSPAAGSTVTGMITVSATASDNVGVTGVQFTLDGTNLGVEDVTSPYGVSWDTTTATNASHTVTAIARDAAGNWATSSPVMVTVNNTPLDTIPPSGSIFINGPAAATNNVAVTLTLSATDDSGTVSQMRVSNDGTTYSTSEPYAATKLWTLSTGDGVKTVSVKFADAAGNWSNPVSDTIMLDTTAPQIQITSPKDGDIIIPTQ